MKHLLLLLLTIVIAGGSEPFVLLIKTDNPGLSGNTAFMLPLHPGSEVAYDFTVSWGDGTSDVVTTNFSPTHVYSTSGTYAVAVTENVVGGFSRISFSGGGDCQKVVALTQWGDVTWSSMNYAFTGCAHMQITATDGATAKTGGVTDFDGAWANCTSLTSFPLIDTSSGTRFYQTWLGCTALTGFPLINTSAGTLFNNAWRGCTRLTGFPLIDTSSGTSFEFAWAECPALTSFPLLDMSAAISLYGAWYECTGLTGFPPIAFPVATTLTGTWALCSGMTSFSAIDTPLVTDFTSTWYECTGLTSFPVIDTSAGTKFIMTWKGCTGLSAFPLLDTSAGTDFYRAWYGCSGLIDFPTLDLRNMRSGNDCFGPTGISSASYSALLIRLADNNTNVSVVFGAGTTSRYRSSAANARNNILIGARGWVISDGGLEPPTITSSTTVVMQTNTTFSYQIIASNDPDTYDASPLPSGLAIDSATGAITGTTPATVGIHAITLSATNAGGSDEATLMLYVNEAGAPVITSAATADGTVGKAFFYRITATGTPTSFTAAGLPTGLSLDDDTGYITGMPTTAGTTAITVTATNVHGTAPATLTITIAAADEDDGSGHKCGMGGGISTLLLAFSLGIHRMSGRRRRIED